MHLTTDQEVGDSNSSGRATLFKDPYMPSRKTSIVKNEGTQRYADLLDYTLSQLNALIGELELAVSQNEKTEGIPKDCQYDCLPIIRKLKEAKKYAEISESIWK